MLYIKDGSANNMASNHMHVLSKDNSSAHLMWETTAVRSVVMKCGDSSRTDWCRGPQRRQRTQQAALCLSREREVVLFHQ